MGGRAHQHSCRMADAAHTVVLEDLNIKAMTRSAKGTVETPDRNVRQKAGLNRGILKSNRGLLERQLAHKAGGAGAGRSRRHVADLCSVPTRGQGESQDTGPIPVYGLRPHGQRRTQCRPQHLGQGIDLGLTGPRGRGLCTARGVPVRDPDDP
ncbi:MAG: hypothetical protein OXC13_17550 [Caldilineaceae bacterium]|nr:hypothetical protein [Caldilineaceae bacterium]